jgi:hypothetical protein
MAAVGLEPVRKQPEVKCSSRRCDGLWPVRPETQAVRRRTPGNHRGREAAGFPGVMVLKGVLSNPSESLKDLLEKR